MNIGNSVEISLPGHPDKILIKSPAIPIKDSGPESFDQLKEIHQ